ncbi:zinc-dependent metalloprotease [Tahibacter caeni]|uniref:zinc-dependent metalloprotease n=1 Tax=Tahibacter caeni TaxID=1453545 RepID=UPI002149741D|nr:zinc-dependent metalloprotease [Tahibacter caeni]
MKRFLLWSVTGAGLLASGMAAAQGSPSLFAPVPAVYRAVQGDAAFDALAAEPASARIDVVLVNAAALQADTKSLTLDLDINGPVKLTAQYSNSYYAEDGSLIWQGSIAETALAREMGPDEIAEDAMNSVILVRNGDKITGNVRVGGQLFKIRPLHDARHVVVETDEHALPPDHPPADYRKLFQQAAPLPAGSKAVNANTVIRVLVNYTQKVASVSGDINALINLAVAESNQGYANSGVQITMQLAAKSQVTYTETGNFDTDLARYRGTSDGYMDAIHTQRNSVTADVAVLIVNNTAYCGLASAIGASASTAFAEVYWDCATGYYSFAHEIGHLQSARHDPANDPTNTPYAYGHGFQSTAGGWRTIMAYACSSTTCTRINYWSNPSKTYGGRAMGTTNRNDNARVLNNTRATVAAFR